jgi:hypothetical protein
VDGFNVLHACVLRGRDRRSWWSPEAQRAVAEWLDPFALRHDVALVFDASSARSPCCSAAGLAATLLYAPSADDAIIELVRANTPARRVHVVTADRPLRDRTRTAGAELARPWDFARMIPASQTGRVDM